jgi:mannose-1-phosphate guanylyltransferase
MKALLLAAGFGSRLEKLTKATPKCLMKVGGQTMLDHWLGKLDKLGVTDFVINTHYLAEQVDAFISKHPFCDRINISFEPTLLGTGMSLSNHLEWLKTDDCFVVHVDNYCEDSLEGMYNTFINRPPSCDGTMLVFNTNRPRECGIVGYDDNFVLTNFHEKADHPPSSEASGAVYLFSASFLHELHRKAPTLYEISKDLIPMMIGRINCYFTKRYFQDIGRPETLAEANQWFLKQQAH